MNKKAIIIAPRALYVCAPAFDAEPDDEGWYGHVITCTEKLDGGWYKIVTPYRYETYAHKDDMLFDKAEIAREKIEDENVRAGWTHVRLYGGAEGYMRSLQLGAYYDKPTLGEEELRHAVVSLAKQYLGTQYRWGGKSPLGIDCSGLVGSCYLMYGVDMYRNADIKEGFCVHEIERKDMKKGDMLFFKGHVAMYIGDGKYIHSTSRAGSDGVVINSLCPCDPDYREDLANGVLAVGSIF
ncbi:MAG: C40 family peptidase [Clostridium sp.]|nr:C40 family peptidase [Clostridium sp.]